MTIEHPLALNEATTTPSLSRADFRQAIAKAAIALKINRSITGQENVGVSGNLSLEQLFDFANEVARSERDRLTQSYQQWFASQGMSDVWAKATVEVMKRMEQS